MDKYEEPLACREPLEIIRGSTSFYVFFYTSVTSTANRGRVWWSRRRLCTTRCCINIWLFCSNTNTGGLCTARRSLRVVNFLRRKHSSAHFHCLPEEQETCSCTVFNEPPLRSDTFMARDASVGGPFRQCCWKSSTFSVADRNV